MCSVGCPASSLIPWATLSPCHSSSTMVPACLVVMSTTPLSALVCWPRSVLLLYQNHEIVISVSRSSIELLVITEGG